MTPLPSLLVLTDRRACERRGRTLVETVAAAAGAGARAFVLREKDLERERRRELCETLRDLLGGVGGIVIVASDPGLARETGTGWAHLAERDPWPDEPAGQGVGRSCHDAASLLRARRAGAAYATVSPIFPSASKPGHGPALGLDGLTRMVATVPGLPVYALGGVDSATAAGCRSAGASGVAVMGAVMAALDPGAATRGLLEALGDAGRGGRAPVVGSRLTRGGPPPDND